MNRLDRGALLVTLALLAGAASQGCNRPQGGAAQGSSNVTTDVLAAGPMAGTGLRGPSAVGSTNSDSAAAVPTTAAGTGSGGGDAGMAAGGTGPGQGGAGTGTGAGDAGAAGAGAGTGAGTGAAGGGAH